MQRGYCAEGAENPAAFDRVIVAGEIRALNEVGG